MRTLSATLSVNAESFSGLLARVVSSFGPRTEWESRSPSDSINAAKQTRNTSSRRHRHAQLYDPYVTGRVSKAKAVCS